jgi:peptide/nickel transport system substrate-binding protein
MKQIGLILGILMLVSLTTSCGGPAPQPSTAVLTQVVAAPTAASVASAATMQPTAQVQAAPTVTAAPGPTAPPAAAPPEATKATSPTVGGNLIYAVGFEVDTLDAHKSGRISGICQYYGSSLIARDPQTGEFIPYLAESWTIAADGMRYEFKLRKDVKFHDGAPLTAQDYAWSFMRAKDPKTQSPTAGPSLSGLAIAEATDAHTLVFKMAWPNSALMDTLADPCYQQPLPRAYVEEKGEDFFGRHPVGVGPFRFKEWVTGQKIVLERNPDYTWGPKWTHGGPPYIATIEFRMIPEYSTQIAGFEAGQIDWINPQNKDVERLQKAGQYQLFEVPSKGSGTHVAMNAVKPPFDDVRVRQALNYAINRTPFIKVIELGYAEPLYGPLTPATGGYWPGIKDFAYSNDLNKAKALMAEAGWRDSNGDGVLDKDGKPWVIDVKVGSWAAKHAEILQQQLKALGAKAEIQQLEQGVLYEVVGKGDFDLTIDSLGWENFGILFPMLHSSMVGAWNRARVTDLNDMIGAMTAAANWDDAVKAAEALQKEVVKRAYYVPLYAGKWHIALNNRVKGVIFSPVTQRLYLQDAYIETTK